MSKFKLNIVTYSKKLMEREVKYLKVRTVEGDIGILANHSPLVVELSPGEMKIKDDNKDEYYYLSGGFLEISNNVVNIIADQVIYSSDIDYQRAQDQVEEAKLLMEKAKNDDKAFLMAEKKLKEALAKMSMKNRL